MAQARINSVRTLLEDLDIHKSEFKSEQVVSSHHLSCEGTATPGTLLQQVPSKNGLDIFNDSILTHVDLCCEINEQCCISLELEQNGSISVLSQSMLLPYHGHTVHLNMANQYILPAGSVLLIRVKSGTAKNIFARVVLEGTRRIYRGVPG